MAVVCNGITMFDIRSTLKREAGEEILMGHSVWIATDGLAWNVDNTKNDLVHGWAMFTVAAGDMLTIVTTCRMEVGTAQTIGNKAYCGDVGTTGSAPGTGLLNSTRVCGFAYKADALFLVVGPPTADGGAHA